MARTKVPINIPTNQGLDLANPVSALAPGKLVRAQNKAPRVWGPRHGATFVDRVSRGRANPEFNGTTTYLTGYYNSTQMDLGKYWTINVLFELGAIASTKRYIISQDNASIGGFELYHGTTGIITGKITDAASNTATVTGTSTHSEDDIVHVRLVRNNTRAFLYVDTVLEAVDTGTLSSSQVTVVRASDLLVGKAPTYAGSGTFFIGTMGPISIISGVDTDFTYAYAELPNPRTPDVLAAWTGELIESDAYVFDASAYANPLECSNVASGSRVANVIEPVHHVKNATTLDGRRRNMVLVGGRLFGETV